MKGYMRPSDELMKGMQRTHDEQQSSMDEVIRQVSLLAVMIKEIQEDKARYEVKQKEVKEERVIEAEEKEPADAEQKLGALRIWIETVEIEPDGKEILVEEESITTPPDDEAPRKILEEASDEHQVKEVKVIKRNAEVDNTLCYLKSEEMNIPDEKVEDSTNAEEEDEAWIERLPQLIDQSEGCCYEDNEPELKGEKLQELSTGCSCSHGLNRLEWANLLTLDYVPRKIRKFKGRTRTIRKSGMSGR